MVEPKFVKRICRNKAQKTQKSRVGIASQEQIHSS